MAEQVQCCGTCKHAARGDFIYENGCLVTDALICQAPLPVVACVMETCKAGGGTDCPCYAASPPASDTKD